MVAVCTCDICTIFFPDSLFSNKKKTGLYAQQKVLCKREIPFFFPNVREEKQHHRNLRRHGHMVCPCVLTVALFFAGQKRHWDPQNAWSRWTLRITVCVPTRGVCCHAQVLGLWVSFLVMSAVMQSILFKSTPAQLGLNSNGIAFLKIC